MKKLLNVFMVTILVFLGLSNFSQIGLADNTTETLISDLVYDKESRVLSGKTVPNANVSLADIVAMITADDEGNFSVPIPEDLQKTTITIMDFLNDQSTDINYNFVAETIDTTAEHIEPQTTESSVSRNSLPTQVSSVENKVDTPQKDSSVLIWVIALVVIVILTILGIFLFNKQKKQKQAQLNERKKNNSGRRKRRKKSSK